MKVTNFSFDFVDGLIYCSASIIADDYDEIGTLQIEIWEDEDNRQNRERIISNLIFSVPRYEKISEIEQFMRLNGCKFISKSLSIFLYE